MRNSISVLVLAGCLVAPAYSAPKKAKNIILFVADAAGVATVNAASLHGYGEPQKLFIQSWPQIGLSDTSTATDFVTDSAAGMTAIVTGRKTQNGVVSMDRDAVRGKKDGTTVKTILEYAEEKGLSTGVVSNMSIADATPAACYAHNNDRRNAADIFAQIFNPRFGDGVDFVSGAGRKTIWADALKKQIDIESLAAGKNRKLYSSVAETPDSDPRPVTVVDADFDVPAATRQALARLSKNRKGYFLMVEWDAHTDNPQKGLDSLVGLDQLIREIAGQVNPKETLLVFAADHSFDLRVRGGRRGTPLLAGWAEWQKTHTAKDPVRLAAVHIDGGHTGEEIVVAAKGPGEERVHGFFPNTRIFDIMMAAYGWKP
jgi:alkaline phosphatase